MIETRPLPQAQSDETATTATARVRYRLLLRICTRQDVEVGLAPSLALAAALESELCALYIEEEASIDASALPFPTMVGFSGTALAMDPGRVQGAFRREAESCRRLLARAAERARLAWSFQAGRGNAAELLRRSSAAGDILVLRRDRLGPRVDDLLAGLRDLAPMHGGVLALPARPGPEQGPLVTFGRSPAMPPALRPIADRLARALATGTRHVPVPEDATPAEIRDRLAGARMLLARVETPLFDDPATLPRIAGTLRAPLLLLRGEG